MIMEKKQTDRIKNALIYLSRLINNANNRESILPYLLITFENSTQEELFLVSRQEHHIVTFPSMWELRKGINEKKIAISEIVNIEFLNAEKFSEGIKQIQDIDAKQQKIKELIDDTFIHFMENFQKSKNNKI